MPQAPSHRSAVRLALSCIVLAACGPVSHAADGGLDASLETDAGADEDAALDAARADSSFIDARADARSDAEAPDAGSPLDLAAARAFRDAVCGAHGYAACTVPWACGCEVRGEPPDETTCARDRVAECEAALDGIEWQLGLDGIRTIEPAMVEGCAATLRASFDACRVPPPLEGLFACIHMMRSPLPVGSRCSGPGLCADGAGFCGAGEICRSIAMTEGATCAGRCGNALACVAGTCSAPLREGGSCADDEDCAAPHRCTGGVCGPLLAAGSPCTTEARCEVGLTCAGGACTEPADTSCNPTAPSCSHESECVSRFESRCVERLAIGASCYGDASCIDGAYCDFSSRPGICEPLRGIDEPCRGGCVEGLVCDYLPERGDTFCVEPLREGELCGARSCAAELVCFEGVCRPLPGVDERCEGTCQPGLYCHFPSSTCLPAATEGEVCDDGSTFRACALDLACVYDGSRLGRCERVPGVGERCDAVSRCREGAVCVYLEHLGYSECMPPAAAGEICYGLCADPDRYCGEEPDRGVCTPAICSLSFGGGIEPPPPPPMPAM